MDGVASLEILTILWCTFWALVSLRRVARGARDCIIFIYFIFYGLFVVPLICDFVYGVPTYASQPAFYDVARDSVARILYCLYVSLIAALWLAKQPSVTSLQGPKEGAGQKVTSALLFTTACLPLPLVFFAPRPSLYLNYGFVITEQISLGMLAFHAYMSAMTNLAVLSAAAFIVCAQNARRALVWVSPLIIASIFINGKRNIFALAVFLIILAFWYRGELKGRHLVKVTAAALIALGIFSYEYQSHLRQDQVDTTSRDEVYENVRIDYGRDSRIKMALYAELHPNRIQILEFRGQSLLFYATFWVPRSVWPDKPYPFATYFTSAMFGRPPGPLGWGMTTSIFDEGIANFSWLGLLYGPLIIWIICKIGDSCRDQQVSLFTTLIASLFLAVHLSAFMVLFLAWILVVVSKKRKGKIPSGRPLLLKCRISSDGEEMWSLVRTT